MHKNGHWARFILLAGLLAAGTATAASSVESDLDRIMPLSLTDLINLPVVTASRQLETRDQTPSHILVITREQIRERRYRNLADLLEDLPGVDFMRGTKSSAYNNFSVQGHTGPNKLLVMLDGVRIGNPAGGNFPVAENLALYSARQVEVLFGPAAALYGADAVAVRRPHERCAVYGAFHGPVEIAGKEGEPVLREVLRHPHVLVAHALRAVVVHDHGAGGVFGKRGAEGVRAQCE